MCSCADVVTPTTLMLALTLYFPIFFIAVTSFSAPILLSFLVKSNQLFGRTMPSQVVSAILLWALPARPPTQTPHIGTPRPPLPAGFATTSPFSAVVRSACSPLASASPPYMTILLSLLLYSSFIVVSIVLQIKLSFICKFFCRIMFLGKG